MFFFILFIFSKGKKKNEKKDNEGFNNLHITITEIRQDKI